MSSNDYLHRSIAPKAPTGITGFDEMTGGGLACGPIGMPLLSGIAAISRIHGRKRTFELSNVQAMM